MGHYTLFTHNNGKLVEVATFCSDNYPAALEALKGQTELFRLMNPGSTFDPFITQNRVIVAQGEKGDLDTWTAANKGIGRYMKV